MPWLFSALMVLPLERKGRETRVWCVSSVLLPRVPSPSCTLNGRAVIPRLDSQTSLGSDSLGNSRSDSTQSSTTVPVARTSTCRAIRRGRVGPSRFPFIVALDGCFFGTSFPMEFLIHFPEFVPSDPIRVFEPKLFGFAIHKESKAYREDRFSKRVGKRAEGDS